MRHSSNKRSSSRTSHRHYKWLTRQFITSATSKSDNRLAVFQRITQAIPGNEISLLSSARLYLKNYDVALTQRLCFVAGGSVIV
jgi:hypothetical protein